MSNVSDLNEWNEYCDGELSTGRPQWFKMWCEKYAAALDIENLDNDLTPTESQTVVRTRAYLGWKDNCNIPAVSVYTVSGENITSKEVGRL